MAKSSMSQNYKSLNQKEKDLRLAKETLYGYTAELHTEKTPNNKSTSLKRSKSNEL